MPYADADADAGVVSGPGASAEVVGVIGEVKEGFEDGAGGKAGVSAVAGAGEADAEGRGARVCCSDWCKEAGKGTL